MVRKWLGLSLCVLLCMATSIAFAGNRSANIIVTPAQDESIGETRFVDGVRMEAEVGQPISVIPTIDRSVTVASTNYGELTYSLVIQRDGAAPPATTSAYNSSAVFQQLGKTECTDYNGKKATVAVPSCSTSCSPCLCTHCTVTPDDPDNGFGITIMLINEQIWR